MPIVCDLRAFSSLDRPPSWERPRLAPRPERLERSVDVLPGVGPTIRRKLEKLGLATIGDLLTNAPFRHVGASTVSSLFGEDEEVAIEVEVGRVSKRRPRARLTIVEATVSDGTGTMRATWFNQPWVAEQLKPGVRVRLIGTVRRGTFAVRSHEVCDAGAPERLVPVYHASEDVSPKKLRELVGTALESVGDFPDFLPADLKTRRALPLKADALHALHRPSSLGDAERARSRLAFDELLVLQLGLARRRAEGASDVAPALAPPGELVERYRGILPFRLTPDQERAVAEIDADLVRPVPMERLLQGDVGSGKTVVALYALLRAVESGRQGALMAPTETLAEQHFLTLEGYCRELGVTVGLLTSSVGKRDRERASGASLLVGTHALIQEGVDLGDLAVAVVDEQHRFGVEQRRALSRPSPASARAGRSPAPLTPGAAAGTELSGPVLVNTVPSGAAPPSAPEERESELVSGRSPHVLHMTATPIPRTLALTVYGDLHVTEISHPPADRKPIVTAWVGAERSSKAYSRLRRHLDDGRQAYVVCPLIEESETSVARAAEVEAERLRQGELRGYHVGLLHGRLRPAERRELMAAFKARELDVLVATTVIEVGVDVPNATIMIVQEADRFGLAQLHQLRGRVGRGADQSYCLLVSRPREELTEIAQERLQALVDSTDGFELAEKDLELRGAGELLGTRQSGLTGFRFARLVADRPLLEQAREDAAGLVDYEGPLADEAERAFAEVPSVA